VSKPEIYCTSYCNQGHRMRDGKPINHECMLLPPAALRAEREDRFEEALQILQQAKPLRVHRGLKVVHCTGKPA